MLIVVSLCVTDASTPLSIALITVPSPANAKISPVAARTEPSITPVGGMKKLVMIRAIAMPAST